MIDRHSLLNKFAVRDPCCRLVMTNKTQATESASSVLFFIFFVVLSGGWIVFLQPSENYGRYFSILVAIKILHMFLEV